MATTKATLNDLTLTIGISGRIDSLNASAVEAEIAALIAANPCEKLILDAEELLYISSAGLRIILRLLKSGRKPKMINVTPEVYDVLETTGFTEMMTVEKAYRRVSVEGCEIIGKGANGAVFELLNATSISRMLAKDPEKLDECVHIFIDLLKIIHAMEAKPGDLPDMRTVAVDWARFLKGHIPDDQWERLCRLVEAVPADNHVMHGDYHINNVMVQNGEPLLIDMDTVCCGHPVFELASMFNAFVGFSEMDHSIVLNFLRIPYELAGAFWEKSLRLYLGSEDESYLQSVAEKAMVVGYMRLLRRTLRREADTELGQKRIALYKARLAELLEKVDTLVF